MMNNLNNQLVKGIAIGIGIGVVGFYAYKKNEDKVNSFLKQKGIDVPTTSGKDLYSMSLEELMETKETIEDIIAEKDLSGVTIVSSDDDK